MDAKGTRYPQIQSDTFDGTTLPIKVVPNWLKSQYRDKTLRFSQIPSKDLMPIPRYGAKALLDAADYSPASTILRFTYTVPYMGNYDFDYKEYAGGHLAVDVRSIIGTPVYAIANGVIERAEIDATGNKFVTIRHDDVPLDGKKQRIFSNYLHLSEILATPGTKIRKGQIIGKVGTTGITTTPHLHFQIDTENAPFHPYFPFTSAERQAAGMSFLQAISRGLGKERAMKYTIHPYNFVNTHLNGVRNTPTTKTITHNKKLENITSYTEKPNQKHNRKLENIVQFSNKKPVKSKVAGKIYTPNETTCQKIYNDINQNSKLWQEILHLQDKYCLFRARSDAFLSEKQLSRGEAMRIVMRYYNFPITGKNSRYLDIPLSDTELQSFAHTASQMWFTQEQYFQPNKQITKWELLILVDTLKKLGNKQKKSQQYNDITKGNTYYNAAQKYATLTHTSDKYFSIFKPVTKGDIIDFLAQIESARK